MTDQTLVLLTVGKEATNIWILIVIGYVARRSGFVGADAAYGIGQIAGRVSLPALIFRLVATADLGSVDWRIVGCMQLCQVAASLGAGLMAFCMGGAFPQVPCMSLGGAFALFVTNVDYTAVGIPLIRALFPESYLLYLYMFLLINVCLFVPVTFLAMEIGTRSGDLSDKKCGVALLIRESMIRVITNPIVIAGVLGMAWNLCTHGAAITGVVNDTLVTLGSAFRTCALFNLGMGIVGRVHDMTVKGSILPITLALWKSMALPAMAQSLTKQLIGDFEGKFVFCCGIVGSAASTPLMIAMFLPDLVDTMRLSTIINLVLSMPIFLISAILYSSDSKQAEEVVDWFRHVSDVGSLVGLVIVFVGFTVVPRWRRYPMLFTLDLVLFDLPFHIAHFFCTSGQGYPTTYLIGNILRQAWLAYGVGLAMIMVALAKWDAWYPNIPWGYPDVAKIDGRAAQLRTCAFHVKLWRMQWILRSVSLAYGAVLTLVFVGQTPSSYVGCWVEYGDIQWKMETAQDTAFFVIGLGLMIAYTIARMGPGTRSTGVLSRIAVLLWCMVGHLYISSVLAFNHLGAPFDPLGFAHQLLLVLDVFLRDGGGLVLLFVLEGVYGVAPSVEALKIRVKRCVLGTTRSDELRLLVARIARDPSIEVFLVHGLGAEAREETVPMTATGSLRRASTGALSSTQTQSHPSDARTAILSTTAASPGRADQRGLVRRSGSKRVTFNLPSDTLETDGGQELPLDGKHAGPGFKLTAVRHWLSQSDNFGKPSEADAMIEELLRRGLLEKATLKRISSSPVNDSREHEEYCCIHFGVRENNSFLVEDLLGEADDEDSSSDSESETIETSDHTDGSDVRPSGVA